jgi:hypothetical protein
MLAKGGAAPFKLPKPKGVEAPLFYNFSKGERLDLVAWAKFFKAAGYISETTDSPGRDVLLALEVYAPQFTEWREGRARPHCRLPVQLDKMGMVTSPPLPSSHAMEIFPLRMHARLAVGDSAAALADFQDMLQWARIHENPRGLVPAVLGVGVVAVSLSKLGESLTEPQWDDAELRQLQSVLAALEPGQNFRAAVSTERISSNIYCDRLARHPAERKGVAALLPNADPVSFLQNPNASASWQENACMLLPSRVFRENELLLNQYFDELAAKLTAKRMPPASSLKMSLGSDKLDGFLDDYYFAVFKLYTELTENTFALSFLSLQMSLDQTQLAIALELFRRTKGEFPEKLEELVPDFIDAIPMDVYSEQPPIYRRTEGGYLLYGVDKDRRDDGGDTKKDRVWRYAPKEK